MTHQDVIDALKEQVDGRYDVIHEKIPYYNGVPHAIGEIDLVDYLRAEDQLDIFEAKSARGYKRQARGQLSRAKCYLEDYYQSINLY